MNTFDEARKYFEKFVQNHSREYFESMKEYGSRSYGEFINSSEIIQTSRDIAHNLREEFCDLEIGNHFVSPKHLIDTVKNLKNYLQSKDAVFKKTIDYYTKREGSLPLPVSGIKMSSLFRTPVRERLYLSEASFMVIYPDGIVLSG